MEVEQDWPRVTVTEAADGATGANYTLSPSVNVCTFSEVDK